MEVSLEIHDAWISRFDPGDNADTLEAIDHCTIVLIKHQAQSVDSAQKTPAALDCQIIN